ncbi:hypothetical protein HN011_002250 [Eciton burchellii]|nr:hypothetical protein HN011_002250 [Eciton burchellii]
MDSAIRILPLALCFARVIGDAGASAKLNGPFLSHSRKPQLIAFNTKGGDIDISWDVSVPFFTIPLNRMSENGEVSPLLTVNTKGLSVAGILTAILTLAVPLLSKPGPGMHYRNLDSQWSRMGDTINELVLGNSFIAPCLLRVVCSIVSEASHSDSPTSTDKIIDGLSSHKWFKEFTNGTVLQEAVRIGREGHRDCSRVYRECLMTPRVLRSMMAQLGAM